MKLSIHTKNFIYLFSGDVGSRLLGFLATVYLARILGTSGFGIINIGLAILSYALIVGDGGLQYLGVRETAGNRENLPEFSGQLLSTRFLLSFATLFAGIIIIYVFLNSYELQAISTIYLLYLLPSAFMLNWYYQGRKQISVISLGKFIGVLSYLLFILLFVHTRKDLLNIAWAWTLGILINAAVLWIVFFHKNNSIKFHWQTQRFQSLLKAAFPLGFATLISQVVLQFPPIFIGIVSTTSDVGLYSAAFKLIVLLLFFDRAFYVIFYPTISYYFQKSPENLQRIFLNVLKLTVTLALIVGLFSILCADFIIKLVFSASFKDAVLIFQIMNGYFILTLISSVLTYTLIGMNLEKIYTKSLIAGMIVFLVAILILGKSLSAVGAAAAIVIYILTSLIFMAVGLKPHLPLNYVRLIGLPLTVTLIVFLPILTLTNLALILKLVIAIGICFPLIAWLSGVGVEEIKYLKRALIWN
jgi:O-antigen/teichoic acid export membrane protein